MTSTFFKQFIPRSFKNIYHFFNAVCASVVFGFPGKKLQIIGVTGTDGKTTTVQCIATIFREAGKKVAVASTINFRIHDREWTNTSKFTTLSGWRVQKFLREAVNSGCEIAILEVSSHALDQCRVWGVPFEVAVITNITREHLDYHVTMEKYRYAKRKLFKKARVGIVNLDMERSEEFLEKPPEKHITYSRLDPSADILAEQVNVTLEGSTFLIGELKFHLNIPGLFNVENALASIATAISFDIPLDIIRRVFENIHGVRGRMERVPNNRDIVVLIDYAVTPNALEQLYALIKSMKSKESSKIIAVFGACGNRDRGKRPLMGEIVSSYADSIILTNEDPYMEDPERIVSEIKKGIVNKKSEENLFVVMDRREAIAKALQIAVPGDIVVVTGKGAEETMAIGDKRILWNDRHVIEEELKINSL